MEAKIDQLTSSITSLVRQFLQTEVSEYRENYEYMLNSPLCRKLLSEIESLKKENKEMTSSQKPNIELEIKENEDQDYLHNIDRPYKLDTSVNATFNQKESITLEAQNEELEEEFQITDNEEEGEEVEVTDQDEDQAGEADESHEINEVKEVPVTDHDEDEDPVDEVEEGEDVEVTEEESGGEEEVEEVEVTEEDSGGEEEVEEVEVTDEESGGEEEVEEVEEVEVVEVTDEESGEEEEDDDDEEEEVFEFEHEGVMYFATNEENGILYACVDDDIGDEVGKIENKNVILY